MSGILGSMLKIKSGKAAVVDSEASAISAPGWAQETQVIDQEEEKQEQGVQRMIYDVGIGVEEDWTEDLERDKKESCLDISASSTYRAYVVGLFISIGLVVGFGGIRNQVSLFVVVHVLTAVTVVIALVVLVSIRIVQNKFKSVCWFFYVNDDEDDEFQEDSPKAKGDEVVEIIVSSTMVMEAAPKVIRQTGYSKKDLDDPEGRPWIRPTGPKICEPDDPPPKVDIEYIEVIMANCDPPVATVTAAEQPD